MNSNDLILVLIGKTPQDLNKLKNQVSDLCNFVDIRTEDAAHFWYSIFQELENNHSFDIQLKNYFLHKVHNVVVVSSTWDGIGSGVLPLLASKLKSWGVSSIILTVLPSKVQPTVAHFNALSSVGLEVYGGEYPILLIDRECLENYVGVNRKGSIVKGKAFVNEILELLFARKTLVDELKSLSKSFDSKFFAILLSTGASLRIYESLENIFRVALLRPLLKFDLSKVSVLYALLRIPVRLRDKLSREEVELTIADWFKDSPNLKSIQVCEPIYTDDTSDRIDVMTFVGGFDLSDIFAPISRKVIKLKNEAVKKGFMSEELWRNIVGCLTES
ncbi:MAG: hypothetical protein ACPLW5_00605 [Candidatus Bathyarchaeales archaeon]